MHIIDWGILAAVVGIISCVAWSTKRYTQSVADFLAANRCAGKYLLGVADGIAGLGAITIVAMFEMYYKAGFTGVWWGSLILPVTVFVAMTGWIQYRYRETRALTMAQFFEIRYSRRFRVMAGALGCLSGVVNFGIFPAVGGRFFQYYCGLPVHAVNLGGLQVDLVYAAIMLILLSISLSFTFMGGQIAVMVTDFLQGSFCNIALLVVGAYLLLGFFDWSQIAEAVSKAPADASLVNPMKTSGTDNFNLYYYLIQAFVFFFMFMAWQGNQGYFCAAKTPHDAKMGRVFGSFRTLIQSVPMVLLPVGAYALLVLPEFSTEAESVRAILSRTGSEQMASQLTVTVAITKILPVGLLGIFASVMFAAFVSTHDTYLHSWGSIFVQDVLLPLRQIFMKDAKPLSPDRHMKWLRIAIAGVAVFIFVFSLLFNQKQDIFMFFALTGTIYLGWAGVVIVGGLYWKRGNVAGAWAATVFGFLLALMGWYITYYWSDFYTRFGGMIPASILPDSWDFTGEKCPASAQILFFWTIVLTAAAYISASLITGRGRVFNMERMLHRGEYAVEGDHVDLASPATGWRVFGMGAEFTRGDRIAFLFSYGYIAAFTLIFIVGTAYAIGADISDLAWIRFWHIYCKVMLLLSGVLAVWLTVGGAMDLKKLMTLLKDAKRNATDDGTVVGHHNLADEEE